MGRGQGALRQTNAEKPRPGFSVVVLAGHRALKLPSRARSCLWRQAERVLLYQGHLSVSVWGAMSGPAGKKEGWEDERELEEKSLCFTGRKKKKSQRWRMAGWLSRVLPLRRRLSSQSVTYVLWGSCRILEFFCIMTETTLLFPPCQELRVSWTQSRQRELKVDQLSM